MSADENNDYEYLDDLKLDENNHNCGLGYWRPKCLQNWAKSEIFLINFSLVAIFQGATFTYMIGSLSTLEKRFSFESKISGFILIADNVSQIFVSPFIGFLATKYHRPRIMAVGELISAFSCFIFALPYFIYGPALHLLHTNHANSTHGLCTPTNDINECNASTVWSAVAILWFANFLNGVGYSAFYTVGVPYMDDNTSKQNSPIYLSTSAALRLCGPAFGLILSSYTLSYYENPNINPNISPLDPRWIGCWWLGFLLIGIFLIIFSIPLSFFPRHMNRHKIESNRTNKKSDDIWTTTKRLASNPIFVFHLIGGTFRLVGYLGYYIFKPKYIESQFRKSASVASFWTGFTSIPTMALGIMLSGIALSKIKPKSRNLAVYIFCVEIIITLLILYAKTFQCSAPVFPETQLINGRLELENSCNSGCHCSTKVFQPVCERNHVFNYFSPCHAGCTQERVLGSKGSNKLYLNCKCNQFNGEINTGYCPHECNQFTPYLILFATIGVISSTAKIGDTLIVLRCIEPRDKTIAVGIGGSVLAIFAFIPYPMIFGWITDSACMVWKESCGKTGNCWLYDIEKFTNYLHNSAFGFMIVGTLFHLMVVAYAHRIKNMFDDEDIDPTQERLIKNDGNDLLENTVYLDRIK